MDPGTEYSLLMKSPLVLTSKLPRWSSFIELKLEKKMAKTFYRKDSFCLVEMSRSSL